MREFKTAVIGAGSTYTPELISGFIERAGRLGARSFAFCDTDMERGRSSPEWRAECSAGRASAWR